VVSSFLKSVNMDEDSNMDKKTYNEAQTEMFVAFQQQQGKQQTNSSPSKTRELETVHKMGGDWFESSPPYLSSSSSCYSNQMVWDITNGCYEEMPVQQSPPDSPLMVDPSWSPSYICPPQLETDVVDTDSFPLSSTSSVLPLVGLFGGVTGVIMDFVDNLYTSSLVQYVCYKTRPSANRLAAETLARSNLNPNAKEFKPVVKDVSSDPEELSSQAGKFVPEANEVDVQAEEGFPTEDKDQECKTEEKIIQSNDAEIHTDKEPSSPVPKVDITDKTSVDNSKVVKQPESCSDSSKCDIKEEISWIGEPSEDSDSEDWWDSDEEEPLTPCQDIDPSEFEDLFPCGLLVSNLPCKSSCLPSTLVTVSCSPALQRDSSPNFTSVACITLAPSKPITSNKPVDRANRIFKEAYSDVDSVKPSPVKVSFCDDINYLYEPEDLTQDLAEARVSDFKQRQVDRERMERLLAPVFTTTHRKKMFDKIYGDY